MIPINSTFAPIQVFVDELVRSGMTHAVTCPGSRNAPIALTLAEHPGLNTTSVLDERSAGFLALGIAKTSGRPVAITCTSGTAAANLMPAVVEAHEAAVPLILLTADRPPELREVGAGQAIDQIKLYGTFAKWFVEVGNLPAGRESAVHHRQLGCRAYATASTGRPGPVHLNWPLREPLAPRREELHAADWEGRPGREPWTRVSEGVKLGGLDLDAAPARGLIVCGGDAASYGPAAAELGHKLGWPVLAEPTSNARSGAAISHYDLLLRSQTFAAERPELVIRVGQMPTSKPLRAWLAGCRQYVVDPHLDWHDPTRAAESLFAISPEALDASTVAAREPGAWLTRWQLADALVAQELAKTEGPFEPLAYNALAEIAETVWVSSSLPIRDVESYFPPSNVRVLSNRGANGIDGVVSSAAGAAIATGAPVHLVIGELALIHDAGGLVTARRAGAQLAILCVNNGGGGIFDFLPVSEQAEPTAYEGHIATPVDVDLKEIAALGGLEHRVATGASEVRESLQPGVLVEFRTDRATSLAKHRDLAARIVARLDGGPDEDAAPDPGAAADASAGADADAAADASAGADPAAPDRAAAADVGAADPRSAADAAASDRTAAILARGYRIWNETGLFDASFMTEDFVLEQSPGLPGTMGTFTGLEAAAEATRELFDGFDAVQFLPRGFDRQASWFVVPVTMIATTRGIEQRTELVHIWQARGDKLARMRVLAGDADPLAEIAKLSQ